MKKFSEKANYPISYGNSTADKVMVSDYVVEVVKSEKFQRYMGSVGFTLLAVISRAQPVSAIPPKYGEAAANIAEGVGQNVPPLGDLAGTANVGANAAQGAAQGANAAQGAMQGHGAMQGMNPGGYYGPGGYHHNPLQAGPSNAVQKPHSAWRLAGPHISACGQYTNTALLIGSVAWICLNASWGNPIFAYGCVGIIGGIINELRKQYIY